MQYRELIERARQQLNPRTLSRYGADAGSVACALRTAGGNIYTGVCIDTPCSMGFCAEHNAIGTMVTGGESHIEVIVAVDSHHTIIPPCGRCREFIYQVDDNNRDTLVVVSEDDVRSLRELLPAHWFENFRKKEV